MIVLWPIVKLYFSEVTCELSRGQSRVGGCSGVRVELALFSLSRFCWSEDRLLPTILCLSERFNKSQDRQGSTDTESNTKLSHKIELSIPRAKSLHQLWLPTKPSVKFYKKLGWWCPATTISFEKLLIRKEFSVKSKADLQSRLRPSSIWVYKQ